MAFSKKLIFKIYNENEVFLEVLTDVISDISITKSINSGDGDFSFYLNRKIDDFDEGGTIDFNNRVKVYLQDTYHPNGDKLIAYGYIVSYSPYLQGKAERIKVECLSAISKLTNDFFREGTDISTAYQVVDLGRELTNRRADQMMTDIIDHYRSTETNSMISNDYSNVEATTDNQGNSIAFTTRFFNMKHLDAIKEASKFFAKNKEGGYYFYWRINTDGTLSVKNISTTSDHSLIIGRHITEITGSKTIENVVNRVYFWNEKGTADPEYIKMAFNDATSQTNYDIISEYLSDSKVTTETAAELLTYSKVYDLSKPKVLINVKVSGKNYDIASFEPGQTVKILNRKNNTFKIGSDENLLIHSIEYTPDEVTLELSDTPENFEDTVEEERQRLDKELTWFGKITQDIQATQLSPSTRAWTTSIIFSPASGANAYRIVNWSAGVVYIPGGSSGETAKRVIAAGTTNSMDADKDYLIYLDELTLPTDSVSQASGTVIFKQGGEVAVDSSKSWTIDQWKGYVIEANSEKQIIKSNTATVLTLEDKWNSADGSYSYNIYKHQLQTTNDPETAVSESRLVFTNARAATDSSSSYLTNSSAIIVPIRASSININGETQIAPNSIPPTRLHVDELSAITANMGTLTAGAIYIQGSIASISSSGDAIFKSVQIGGSNRQYSITDDGILNFGDGSDGAAIIVGDTTLTADKYYTTLKVNAGVNLYPNGYRIFVNDTLTVNGTIDRNGSSGGNGGTPQPYSAGTGGSLSDGYLKGSIAGGDGGLGGRDGSSNGDPGSNGSNTINSIGSSSTGNGGDGGDSIEGPIGGNGGNGGTATTANVKLIANWHLATLLDVSSTGATVKYDNSASAGGGGGGGRGIGASESGGGGGGGGSSGGIIAIYAKNIIINSTGIIQANGGNGGNGGNGNTDGAGGGGGGGGNGGQIILVYNNLINTGAITVSAGTGGVAGTGGSGMTNGLNGTAGSIRYFNISL